MSDERDEADPLMENSRSEKKILNFDESLRLTIGFRDENPIIGEDVQTFRGSLFQTTIAITTIMF